MQKNHNFFIFSFSIISIYNSYKSKYITNNKNNLSIMILFYYFAIKELIDNNFFIFVFLIKIIYSYKNKYANIKYNNNK